MGFIHSYHVSRNKKYLQNSLCNFDLPFLHSTLGALHFESSVVTDKLALCDTVGVVVFDCMFAVVVSYVLM